MANKKEVLIKFLDNGTHIFNEGGKNLRNNILVNKGKDKGILEAGAKGEKIVSNEIVKIMSNLGIEKYVLVNSLVIENDSKTEDDIKRDTDMILIINDSIIIIDAKNFKRGFYGINENKQILKRGANNKPVNEKAYQAQALWAKQLSYLNIENINMIACIAKPSDEVKIIRDKEYYTAPFRLCNLTELSGEIAKSLVKWGIAYMPKGSDEIQLQENYYNYDLILEVLKHCVLKKEITTNNYTRYKNLV